MTFPARPVLAALAGLLALSLLGVAPAGADTVAPTAPTPPTSPAATAVAGGPAVDGDQALDVAEDVLTEGTEPDESVDASMALRDLYLARPVLEGEDADRAAGLLARPTDGNDPFGNRYTAPTTRICGPRVCVHYVRRTQDAPPNRAWVRTNVRVMEEVWRHHVRRLGYRAPRPDGRRGGDARFDVYLKEIGSQGLYGYCAPEQRRRGGHPRQAASYCVLDDDFARSQFGRAPVKTLRVTAAHEFFHAVQYAYDIEEDLWLLESTATWMEEEFADAVNDNRAYLPYGQVRRPQVPVDLFNPQGFEHYGNWPLWEHLTRRFGVGVVRRVFHQVGTGSGLPNRYSVAGLRRVLGQEGGFGNVFTAYAAAGANPAASYREGWSWPKPSVALRRTLTPQRRQVDAALRVDHLAARHVRVFPGRSFGPRWWLNVRVDAPPSRGRYTAAVTVLYDNGRVVRRRVPLSAAGDGRIRTPFPGRVAMATLTLVNASTRYRCDQDTTYACRGEALDDRMPFTARLTAYRR